MHVVMWLGMKCRAPTAEIFLDRALMIVSKLVNVAFSPPSTKSAGLWLREASHEVPMGLVVCAYGYLSLNFSRRNLDA
jgi:hypothetical protein